RTEGVIFAVRAAQVEYLKPARFNDALEVTVELARRGAASINFKQEVRRDGETLCSGEIKIACLNVTSFLPTAIPERVAAALKSGEAP
ncbi:MAG: thioesterase family protein, partial [Gammaproteobacteria bacterium]|nr:thioesterase family protein [Gammaproteobacteria bacterium]